MKNKEIKFLLETEGSVLVLKKKSDSGFLDFFYTNNVIVDLFLFFRRKKYNYLIITEKRIVLINKNELLKNVFYDFNKGLRFNSITFEISFFDENLKSRKVKCSFLKVSYEEVQLIKNKLENIGK